MAGKAGLDILWSDGDFVAVFKPAGLATIPGRAETDSVLERLGRQLQLPSSGSSDPRIRVVHRLDKFTSGVLVFAKNVEAQRLLSEQFRGNRVEKEYLALIAGRPQTSEGEIDAPLARHPSNPHRMTVVAHGGRPARTRWQVLESFRAYTLLRVFPKTGRTHQIRVHLSHAGLPLAIDPVYHPAAPPILLSACKRSYRPAGPEPERPLIARLTLHAAKLAFEDGSNTKIQLEAPLPKDLRATLNMLRKYGR